MTFIYRRPTAGERLRRYLRAFKQFLTLTMVSFAGYIAQGEDDERALVDDLGPVLFEGLA